MLRVSEQPPFTIDFGQLKPVEHSILRAAGRGATIQSITERLEQDRGRTLRACYGLLCAGLLEEGDSDRPRRPLKVQEETGVFLLSDLEKKFAKIQATNARQEILIEFAESDGLDQTEEGETVESSPAQLARAQEAIEKGARARRRAAGATNPGSSADERGGRAGDRNRGRDRRVRYARPAAAHRR